MKHIPFTKNIRVFLAIILTLITSRGVTAENWPTYRHDYRRSGVTTEILTFPLSEKWVFASPAPPNPAWPGPAKWDAYARIDNITSMRNFDPVFHVTIAGENLYFGSSVDDGIHCLDTQTGEEKWWYCTDAPVRLPPTCFQNRLYFGSDDGNTYCIDADTRKVIWKYKPAPDNRRIQNNGKFISLWPCRTGVIVQDDIAYFGHSLLPWRESYLCAVNARTGKIQAGQTGTYEKQHNHLTMQGAMLASASQLYISQGRQQPIVCHLATGEIKGALGNSGDGGVFALVTEDDTLFHGRGQNHGSFGELRVFDGQNRDYIAKFPKATHLVICKNIAYMTSLDEISAFDRGKYFDLQHKLAHLHKQNEAFKAELKKLGENDPQKENLLRTIDQLNIKINQLKSYIPDCYIWRHSNSHHHDLIMTGETLILGGANSIIARRADNGEEIWRSHVAGRVHGLAVAQGALFVSTDAGKIYCFR